MKVDFQKEVANAACPAKEFNEHVADIAARARGIKAATEVREIEKADEGLKASDIREIEKADVSMITVLPVAYRHAACAKRPAPPSSAATSAREHEKAEKVEAATKSLRIRAGHRRMPAY